ncbi:hypothetical protein EIK77_004005 [Talaromyces pinophilus]|nr:hypothetical protein EIK77_004005 [Talaromyces pinophilus]PCG90258.1 Barwin-related endoglucanase [Penicillium occitanis (nom. inval.)]PCG90572.1 hypothetical protein PENOC_101380 [Penicillium occitanis (nom. inval.)]
MKVQTILASLALTIGVYSHSVIYEGSGWGTYYYDVEDTDVCGSNFADINGGDVTCGWFTAATLNQVNSDYLVAMNVTQLEDDLTQYCGMQVIVYVNGVESNLPFFIGDGCKRCSEGSPTQTTWNQYGAPGLDFSYTALKELASGHACNDGYMEISWEIVDNKLYSFDA